MAPSELHQGLQVSLSEETRLVVICIMARMVQLMMRLLSNPEHAPAWQENLNELLRQETPVAISK